jgi:hypothetical protein
MTNRSDFGKLRTHNHNFAEAGTNNYGTQIVDYGAN